MLWLLCTLAPALTCAAESTRIRAREDGFMVDTMGRVRIFRGFNDIQAGAKGTGPYDGTNYLPKYLIHEDILTQLEEYGFNAFRIPMMWAAVMPTSDQKPDTAYLQRMMDVTTSMEKHNMYGLLDMHKDTVCFPGSYDGYPRWVCNQSKPTHPYPWPLKKIKDWGDSYLTEQVALAVQDVYDNTYGGFDAWANFWKIVARLFKSQKNVLGYELINEPWAGNEFANPLVMLPGYAGTHNLEPAYKKLAKEIRSVDTETMLMFEPVTWGMLFSGSWLQGSGFDSAPDPNSCFAWHYYCWFTHSSSQNYSHLQRAECDKALGPKVFAAVEHDKKNLKVPTIMTEWGGMDPNVTQHNATHTAEINAVMDMADKQFQSWTYYDLISVQEHGVLMKDAFGVLSRPFAQAIAGTPSSMSFNVDTSVFKLEYIIDASIEAPTEICVPAIRYPNGFEVELSKGLTWKLAEERVSVIAVSIDKDAPLPKGTVTVTITAKKSDAKAVYV